MSPSSTTTYGETKVASDSISVPASSRPTSPANFGGPSARELLSSLPRVSTKSLKPVEYNVSHKTEQCELEETRQRQQATEALEDLQADMQVLKRDIEFDVGEKHVVAEVYEYGEALADFQYNETRALQDQFHSIRRGLDNMEEYLRKIDKAENSEEIEALHWEREVYWKFRVAMEKGPAH